MSQPVVCFKCDEPVLPGEAAIEPVNVMGRLREWHRECAIRAVVGSVGHLRQRCSCYGGTEEDPPGMTPREAARAALKEWSRRLYSPPKECS